MTCSSTAMCDKNVVSLHGKKTAIDAVPCAIPSSAPRCPCGMSATESAIQRFPQAFSRISVASKTSHWSAEIERGAIVAWQHKSVCPNAGSMMKLWGGGG